MPNMPDMQMRIDITAIAWAAVLVIYFMVGDVFLTRFQERLRVEKVPPPTAGASVTCDKPPGWNACFNESLSLG